MRALVIDDYGPASAMQLRDIERPVPGERQVLVRVSYASINPIDYKIRRGDLSFIVPRKFPRVVGVDFAGAVEEVGPGVKTFKPGDQVFGMCNPLKTQYGSYAEFAIADRFELAPIPEELPAVEAASLPVAGLTALKALKQHIGLQPGQNILINGASGGVGSLAVQIGKVLGAQVVATCGQANIEFVKSLGADKVYDYAATDIRELSERFHGFFDASAKYSFSKVKHLLVPRGTYVTTVPDRDSMVAMFLGKLLPGRQSRLVMAGSGSQVKEELTELAQMVITEQIRTIVSKAVQLKDVPQTQEQAEKGHARGKIVIKIE